MKRLNWIILKHDLGMIKLGLVMFMFSISSALITMMTTTMNQSTWALVITFLLLLSTSIPLFMSDNIFKEYREMNESFEIVSFETKEKKFVSKWYYDYIFDKPEYFVSNDNVSREHFNHWKNNIPENRILSLREYVKLKLAIKKYNKQQKRLTEIKEFCKYYDLEPKEIHEIDIVSFDKFIKK